MAWPGSTTQLTQRSNSIAEVPRLKKNEWELPEGHERARLVTNAQGRSRTRKAGPTPQTKRVGTPSLDYRPLMAQAWSRTPMPSTSSGVLASHANLPCVPPLIHVAHE